MIQSWFGNLLLELLLRHNDLLAVTELVVLGKLLGGRLLSNAQCLFLGQVGLGVPYDVGLPEFYPCYISFKSIFKEHYVCPSVSS